MNRNPVIPYAIIAVLGIFTVILISILGVNQRTEIQQAAEGGQTEVQEGETAADPEEIFAGNCAACHGADLSGASAPSLTQIGSELSEDEIRDIIIHGTDAGMPAGLVNEAEAEVLAKWLGEKK